MSEETQLIKTSIDEFNTSKERRIMVKGEQYYKAENDILNRQMLSYENGSAILDETKTNNRLSHGFMHNLVDEKVNYLLIKPVTLTCEDVEYLDLVKDTLGKRFQKKLVQLGTEASNKGIAWLHAYINNDGKFMVMKIPSEQCIPLWADYDREELRALIRYYDVEVCEGELKQIVTKIEYWTHDNVEYYVMQNGEIAVDSEMYLEGTGGHFEINGEPEYWGKVPFIAFKNNDFTLPDLQFVKSLIDNYDLTRSDIANLLEDIKNVIYVLKGHGGENLRQFMRDIAYNQAVKIDACEDAEIDSLESKINIDAALKHYKELKNDIFEFGQGLAKSETDIKFIYSGLDLKCNSMEECFKWAFEQLQYFVNTYLSVTGHTVSAKEVKVFFNRDILVNQSQIIADCLSSKGVIAEKTIISMHPWVDNVENELAQIAEENQSTVN